MANSPRRSINYTPRMTDLEAHDKLHPELKHALETSPFEWSAYSVYRYAKDHTRKETIAWLAHANKHAMEKPWYRGVPNPTARLGLKPLVSNYGEARALASQSRGQTE